MKRFFLVAALILCGWAEGRGATSTFTPTPTATATFTATSTKTRIPVSPTPTLQSGPLAVTTPGTAPRVVKDLFLGGDLLAGGNIWAGAGAIVYGDTIRPASGSLLTIGGITYPSPIEINIMARNRLLLFSYANLVFDCDSGFDFIMYTKDETTIGPPGVVGTPVTGAKAVAYRIMNHAQSVTYMDMRVSPATNPTPGVDDYGPEQRAKTADTIFTAPYATHTPLPYQLITRFQGENLSSYGSLAGDNLAVTVAVAAVTTYYPVTFGLSTNLQKDFTFQNNCEVVCNVAGTYLAVGSVSGSSLTPNEEINATIMVNGTHNDNCEGAAYSTTASRSVPMPISCLLSLSAGQTVQLCVSNYDAAHNIVVRHANLSLFRAGK